MYVDSRLDESRNRAKGNVQAVLGIGVVTSDFEVHLITPEISQSTLGVIRTQIMNRLPFTFYVSYKYPIRVSPFKSKLKKNFITDLRAGFSKDRVTARFSQVLLPRLVRYPPPHTPISYVRDEPMTEYLLRNIMMGFVSESKSNMGAFAFVYLKTPNLLH